MRLAVIIALFCGLASPAMAFQPGDVERTEVILERLALERGAFIACSDDAQVRQGLETSWNKELQAAQAVLTRNGFPADFVAALPTRFAMAAVTPQWADKEGRDRFCAALGDWQRRWDLLYVLPPDLEIGKMLEQ